MDALQSFENLTGTQKNSKMRFMTHEHIERMSAISDAISEGRDLQVKAGWDQAATYFTTLLGELHMGEVAVLNERGFAYRMLGDYDAAEADFIQARQIAQSTEDSEGELVAITGLIDLARTGEWAKKYVRGKDMAQAQVWRTEAEKVLSTMPADATIGKVNAYIQFGLLEHELSNDKQAVQTYEKAEEEINLLLTGHPDDSSFRNRLTRILTLKGNAQHALGQYDDAIATENEALKVYNQLGDVRGIVNAALSLARIYRDKGDIKLAIDWYDKTMKASQRQEGDQVVVIDPLMHEVAKKELTELPPQ